jgi:SAM-dependent methyltransferase
MTARPAYDEIGKTYADTRGPDPRIAARIFDALGDARTVVNVGAGTGSYEPDDRRVMAVEPSTRMIEQRRAGAAPCVVGFAEALPFADDTFDAALASLTIHHWPDWRAGVLEMSRVARRSVIFSFDPNRLEDFWLASEYLPEIIELDLGRFHDMVELCERMGGGRVEHISVPHDCVDGFLAAHWRRPEMYLNEGIRAGMSAFHALAPDVIDRGIAALADDLRSGAWDVKFGFLRELDEIDVGYRLVVSTR